MTPATLRKLEWASIRTELRNRSTITTIHRCPVCEGEKPTHAPDCELDAAIRVAERRETGERPEIRVGDVVLYRQGRSQWPVLARAASKDGWHDIEHRTAVERPNDAIVILAIYRDPLWRKEAPTHD